MKYSTGNNRRSKGQIKKHTLSAKRHAELAEALEASLRRQTFERIAGWQAKIDELLATNGPVEQIAFYQRTIERAQA